MVQKSLSELTVKLASLQSTELTYAELTRAVAEEVARIELVGRVVDIAFHRDADGTFANITYRVKEVGNGK